MRVPFRPGTWRQAVVTYAGVLPVSLVLNFALAPISNTWPRLEVVIFNAALLVATLNWVLLPALHWATRGWAAPRMTNQPNTRAPARRGEIAELESPE